MSFRLSSRPLRLLTTAALAGVLLTGVGATSASAAPAAPAIAAAGQSQVALASTAVQLQSVASQAKGDGVWEPSHDEDTRILPICKGPVEVATFLYRNFADHGRDIARYIERNGRALERLATGRASLTETLYQYALAVAQIPAYALADARYHNLPATALHVLTGCDVFERFGITNPFKQR